MNRKLRMAMVGGGPGSFIGRIHRKAAAVTGQIDLVAGVFSSNPDKNRACGEALFLPADRVYRDYAEMARREAALPDGERADFVAITTPNATHYPIAAAFLDAGFHVLCEKPVTLSLQEALDLKERVAKSGKQFALMHNYTGYPMIKQARCLIREGALGTIHKVTAEYSLGWLASSMNRAKPSTWRLNPAVAGISSCMADIGTHAQNLIRTLTGLTVTAVSADLNACVGDRMLDNDGTVLLRFDQGARGLLFASQVATGECNNFNIRVYGEKASLEWHQETPEELIVRSHSEPTRIYRRNGPGCCPEARAAATLPAGHPEGFIEAFAAVYSAFAEAVSAAHDGTPLARTDFPDIEDGVSEMRFLEAIVRNAQGDTKWTAL